ncbi:hypothetical protein [Streptomyces sp. NPDC053048]|uniref:hypothetical protein n=1 Tax=Streptomyces sp. NPDC053048 TaxID=3365694 RepID=UPI0037CDA8F5
MAKGIAKAYKKAGIPVPDSTPTPAKGKRRERKAPIRGAVQAKAQRRALRRSAARHGARMLGSALLAGAVWGLSGLWNIKRPGVASRHRSAIWRRLAARARRAREKRDARIRGIPQDGQAPVPAEIVNDPARPKPQELAPVLPGRPVRPQPLGGNPREGAPMSETTATGFARLSDAADVMLQAASTFDPEHMTEFQTLIDDLPVAMETVQETLRVLTELSDEKLPVHPHVVEEIGEGYRAMNRVVQALEEVGAVYRRVHADDIERNENPRKGIDGERRWNVG